MTPSDREGAAAEEPQVGALGDEDSSEQARGGAVVEDTDGRDLFEAASKYDPSYRRQQIFEGVYIGGLLILDLVCLAVIFLGGLDNIGVPGAIRSVIRKLGLLILGGLLGGLVYTGKWLYHSIAKGLWHQDRRMWRYLSPWISVGVTVGIWALIAGGFFSPFSEGSSSAAEGGLTPVGIGFVIGYLSDRFLAKMKEITQVAFGQSEQHFGE